VGENGLRVTSVEKLAEVISNVPNLPANFSQYDEVFFEDNFLLFADWMFYSASIADFYVLSAADENNQMNIEILEYHPDGVSSSIHIHFTIVFEMDRVVLCRNVEITAFSWFPRASELRRRSQTAHLPAIPPDAVITHTGTVGDGGAPWRLYRDGTLVVDSGDIIIQPRFDEIDLNPLHVFLNPWYTWNRWSIRRIVFIGPFTAVNPLTSSMGGIFTGLAHVNAIEALPSNDDFTGYWQNVGNGTINNPQGEFVFTSAQLTARENANNVTGNTWVWQPTFGITNFTTSTTTATFNARNQSGTPRTVTLITSRVDDNQLQRVELESILIPAGFNDRITIDLPYWVCSDSRIMLWEMDTIQPLI